MAVSFSSHTPKHAPAAPNLPLAGEDDDYQNLVMTLRSALAYLPSNEKLFTSETQPLVRGRLTSLYDLFLDKLPPSRRHHYECRACRHFVERYGGMVVISEDGTRHSPLWDAERGARGIFKSAVGCLERYVEDAPVVGVLEVSTLPIIARLYNYLGDRSSVSSKHGVTFNHMCVKLPESAAMWPLGSAAVADVREEHNLLARSLSEYKHETVVKAIDLLTSGALPRSETFLGAARWFGQVHEKATVVCGGRTGQPHSRDAVIWRAAANAPKGFCHVRSSLLGTLLDDIQAGRSFRATQRSFAEKVHPLAYQRPQAAPTEGQINQAERLFKELGLAPSLERRYAVMADVPREAVLWRGPSGQGVAEQVTPGQGIFDHLRTRRVDSITLPEKRVTWTTLLALLSGDGFGDGAAEGTRGTITKLEYRCENVMPYFAFVTALHPQAPPILSWDSGHPSSRNPINWYLYHGGSNASRWGFDTLAWAEVVAVTTQPSRWPSAAYSSANTDRFGDGAYFVLKDASDRDNAHSGLALFPEEMRSDLHGVRAVIEAASKAGRIQTPEPGLQRASGVCFQTAAGSNQKPLTFRATFASGIKALYVLDRYS